MAPPPYNIAAGPVRFAELKNPLMQEWAMFRAASIARRYAEYDEFIRKLNPEVALEGNPNLNLATEPGLHEWIGLQPVAPTWRHRLE